MSIQFRYKYLTRIGSDGGRPEILEAANISLERYQRGYKVTGHCVPPRVGKSSIVRIIAIEAFDLGAPFVLHLSPWENLTTQIIDESKSQQFMEIYDVNTRPFTAQSIKKIKHHKFYVRASHIDMLSATLGLVHANKNMVCDAITYAVETTGKRPIIILDEVHVISESDTAKWSNTVTSMIDAGAYVVSMTGTKDRTNSEEIPGFQMTVLSTEDEGEMCTYQGTEINDDGVEVNKLMKNSVSKTKYRMDPIGGVDLEWKVAWDNKWMARMDVIKVDFDVTLTDGSQVLLSELSASNIRKNLSKHLRNEDKCIPFSVKTGLSRLASWRRDQSGTQMLVITGADIGSKDREGANFHARQVRREIETQYEMLGNEMKADIGSLEIRIATSTNNKGEPDDKAKDYIDEFMKGEIDILIVKSMAIVGLDAPSCKINLMLSTLRNGPMALQAITRQLTIWDKCNRSADLIIPYDILAKGLIDKMKAQGGVNEVRTLKEIELIEVEKKEKPEKDESQELGDGRIIGYSDESGNEYDEGDNEVLIFAIRSRWQLHQMTDPEILVLYKKGAFQLPDDEIEKSRLELEQRKQKAVNVNDELAKYEGKFGKSASKFAAKIYSYPTNPGMYRSVLRKIQARAKAMCGVAHLSVSDIEDPEVLKKLIDGLPAAYEYIRKVTRGL